MRVQCKVRLLRIIPTREVEIQAKGYFVFKVKYSSLLTDRNHIYTVCATYVEMATCSTSSLDRHEEVLRTPSIVPFSADRTQPYLHYLQRMRGRL
jgi:hypothetical protein